VWRRQDGPPIRDGGGTGIADDKPAERATLGTVKKKAKRAPDRRLQYLAAFLCGAVEPPPSAIELAESCVRRTCKTAVEVPALARLALSILQDMKPSAQTGVSRVRLVKAVKLSLVLAERKGDLDGLAGAAVGHAMAQQWFGTAENGYLLVSEMGLQALAANPQRGVPKSFVPTDVQRKILQNLNGKALSAKELVEPVKAALPTIKDNLAILKDVGKVLNKRGLGYYRPDKPPDPDTPDKPSVS